MKKSKILISAVTMFSLCITPMSVYAQVDPNSNIENTISQTKSADSKSVGTRNDCNFI